MDDKRKFDSELQQKEYEELLKFARENKIRIPLQLSNFITQNKLGLKFPTLAGNIEFDTGYTMPNGIAPYWYKCLCEDLEFKQPPSDVRVVNFTPNCELYGLENTSQANSHNAIEDCTMTVAEAFANLNAVMLDPKFTKKQLEDAVKALQEAQAREAAQPAAEPEKVEEEVEWTNPRTGEVFRFTGVAAKLVHRKGDITWKEVSEYVIEMQAKFGKDKHSVCHCVRTNINGKTFFSYNEQGQWYVNIFHSELKKGMEIQRALAILRGSKFNPSPTRNPATGDAQLNFTVKRNFHAGNKWLWL